MKHTSFFLSILGALVLCASCDSGEEMPGPELIIDPVYTPYACRVAEYCPAPGQFVNVLPLYEEGDTEADMLRKASESIREKGLISLGGFGGYVTFCFDHRVENRPGPDVAIYGNALRSSDAAVDGRFPGSAEPGIVMVSEDVNENGLPDDPWYELLGSEALDTAVRYGHEVTYVRGAAGADVPWTDNAGGSGFVFANSFHKQPYYPAWRTDDKLTLRGTLLPPNARKEGELYVLYAPRWGYVDCHPNREEELNEFDFSQAVDAGGQPVQLRVVDFVRVYTALQQDCGPLGETSTEVSYAVDLAMMGE